MERTLLSAKDAKSVVARSVPRMVLFCQYEVSDRGFWGGLFGRPRFEAIVEEVWEYKDSLDEVKSRGKGHFPETVKMVSGIPGDSQADYIVYGYDIHDRPLWHAEVWPIKRK